MVMGVESKIARRLFKKHLARFITIIAIVIISVGFMSGIGEVQNKISISVDNQYNEYNMHDLYLKSSNIMGFKADEKKAIIERFGEDNVEGLFTMDIDTETDEGVIRIYNMNLKDNRINKLELLEGRMPEKDNEIVVERKTGVIEKKKIGDKVSIMGMPQKEYEVCGIVYNPLFIELLGEPTFLEPKDGEERKTLKSVYYIHSEKLTFVNDYYVTFNDRDTFNHFSSEYEDLVDGLKLELETDTVSVLSLFQNKGFYSLYSYGEKVGQIGIIFVVFFLLVTVLVVYSTMKRLFDEERSQMACQKTLGFADGNIIRRYMLFGLVATLVGGLIAFPVGFGLTSLLYTAFNMQFNMMPLPFTLNFSYYGVTLVIILFGVLFTTLISGKVAVKQKPVDLLKPKAPKVGKKTFLEYVPVIWKRLSFKYKSTLRNVFLFKSRFFMTVISVIGATVLLFAGLGLMDNALAIEGADSIITIALALAGFSGALVALVIYNMTNINVSERTREIATLMVLGYQDREVAWYIFREIYVMCIIAAFLGLPVGVLFVDFAFNFIDFGSVANINWWTFIITPLATILFGFISTLLLRRKITSVDMNASLKSLE